MKVLPVHYRYDDHSNDYGVEVKVSKLYAVRETRCFYFVISESEHTLSKVINDYKPKERKVSKDGERRYCYPSKRDALNSYKARKESQIWRCEMALCIAKQAVKHLEPLIKEHQCNMGYSPDDVIKVGRPDHFDSLNFY